MARLTLSQSQAITALAEFLYDFLPAKPSPFADPSISFPGVASKVGVGNLWPGQGSKLPQLTTLLSRTLESRPEKFCVLLEEIVATSMKYPKKGNPFREEIEGLNELIAGCGFRVPELCNPEFLRKLQRRRTEQTSVKEGERQALLNELMQMHNWQERQERGFKFENFLNRLFRACELEPRQPFRLVGEQIDGSLQILSDTYLIEARWRNKQANQADLLVLHGKVAGKASWSRGIFISYSGFTADGLEAFQNGKATNLICMSGEDLFFVLSGKMTLRQLIESKARKAAEEGLAYVPAYQIALK